MRDHDECFRQWPVTKTLIRHRQYIHIRMNSRFVKSSTYVVGRSNNLGSRYVRIMNKTTWPRRFVWQYLLNLLGVLKVFFSNTYTILISIFTSHVLLIRKVLDISSYTEAGLRVVHITWCLILTIWLNFLVSLAKFTSWDQSHCVKTVSFWIGQYVKDSFDADQKPLTGEDNA